MKTGHFRKNEARDLYSPTGFDRGYRAAVLGSRALSKLCTRVELPETVELPLDRPLIIAANHSSLFDLIASLIVLGNYGVHARLAVNERFFANPVGGWFLHGIGCIPFSRENREAAELTMVEALRAGQVCAMMPEGKIIREADQVGGVSEGRPGISRVARLSGAAVLPVGFAYSDQAWKPGRPLPRAANFGRPVIARLGPPITLDSDDDAANTKAVMEAISELVLTGRAISAR